MWQGLSPGRITFKSWALLFYWTSPEVPGIEKGTFGECPRQLKNVPAGDISTIADDRSQIDVLELDGRVVALQIDWSWRGRIGVDRAGGWPNDRLVVDDFDPVEHDGDVPIDEREVIGLPLSAWVTGLHCRSDAAEDRADTL